MNESVKTYLSFHIIRLFLPNSGRILPALTEKRKIKNCPNGDWTRTSWSSCQCSTEWTKSTFSCQSKSPWPLSCSIDSRNDQSPKCEMVHETKLTSEISCPTHIWRTQSEEHYSDDRKVLCCINAGRILAEFGRNRRIIEKVDCFPTAGV